MANNVYEGMFLLDSNRYARDPGGVSKQIDQMVQDCGGEMLASRLWSEQKLAYPIAGHRKGTYWLTYFRMDSQKQNDLTRSCRLNDNVLRNLIIRIDDRLVETLVEHATTSASAAGSSSTTATATTSSATTTSSGTTTATTTATTPKTTEAAASDTAKDKDSDAPSEPASSDD